LLVPHRLLVFVSGLTFGDYLLWNWSLNSNHDVLALVSGLTLPPLAVACIWLLALTITRLIARYTRRAGSELARSGASRSQDGRVAPNPTAAPLEEGTVPAGTAARPSGRLAA
jgi:hypothetical protein